jgi:hypothetical protein
VILRKGIDYEQVRRMESRSFFVCKGHDFANAGFEADAIATLAKNHTRSFTLEEPQLYAWREELRTLRETALAYPDCTVAFEYMIPRMGRRVDVVLLIETTIFVVEFKVGETGYPASALAQVEDYVFDLGNFHKESHGLTMVPVLVCTEANPWNEADDATLREGANVLKSNGRNLRMLVNEALASGRFANQTLDHDAWLNSLYSPTPTIVEAARALFQSHSVEEISRSEAGLTNISETTDCVNAIVERTKREKRKAICFVTGVPGAGKTLVGLNIASKSRQAKRDSGGDLAVFLSGNGPLIEVLQASLVEDRQRQNAERIAAWEQVGGKTAAELRAFKVPKREIEGEVKSFVQGVHHFREDYFITSEPPAEHIAIFDEAQRAWSEDQLSYKMKTRWQNKRDVHLSEPHLLIDYLDRHDDWAVIVCLVGGGQEIHNGEAGIIEWFTALRDHHPDWDVYVSRAIESETYLGDAALESVCEKPHVVDQLHLAVDMRSFRNKNVAAFAEALISNRPDQARELYDSICEDYPIFVTRDLATAKDWVRAETKRPSDRYGIVADSYGQRIRADGITVPTLDFDAVKWFLRGKDEIDSSYYMEIAASEFKIQGLEIDYAVVAWEGDYRYEDGEFAHHRFYGGRWQNVHNEIKQRYLKNGYRVLLTRARQGYVIYVPKGSTYDQTRLPEFYDGTYEYLLSAGVQPL